MAKRNATKFCRWRCWNPKLAILDETDSGLDIDALRIVADGVNSLRRPDNAAIVVTHYQRLLNYIVPDFVHVLAGGRIIKSGDKSLALELEAKRIRLVAGAGRVNNDSYNTALTASRQLRSPKACTNNGP